MRETKRDGKTTMGGVENFREGETWLKGEQMRYGERYGVGEGRGREGDNERICTPQNVCE